MFCPSELALMDFGRLAVGRLLSFQSHDLNAGREMGKGIAGKGMTRRTGIRLPLFGTFGFRVSPSYSGFLPTFQFLQAFEQAEFGQWAVGSGGPRAPNGGRYLDSWQWAVGSGNQWPPGAERGSRYLGYSPRRGRNKSVCAAPSGLGKRFSIAFPGRCPGLVCRCPFGAKDHHARRGIHDSAIHDSVIHLSAIDFSAHPRLSPSGANGDRTTVGLTPPRSPG